MTARYADDWRDAFRRGAVDALRLAARTLPPETWCQLAKLTDYYAPQRR